MSSVSLNRLFGSSGASFTLFPTNQPGSVSSKVSLNLLLGTNPPALPWPGQLQPFPRALYQFPLSLSPHNSQPHSGPGCPSKHITLVILMSRSCDKTFQLKTLGEKLLSKRHLRGGPGGSGMPGFLEEDRHTLKPETGGKKRGEWGV